VAARNIASMGFEELEAVKKLIKHVKSMLRFLIGVDGKNIRNDGSLLGAVGCGSLNWRSCGR